MHTNEKIINEIGGGFKEPVKALQIGGPLGGVVPIKEVEKLNLDFQEFVAAGFMLGHASIVSIPKILVWLNIFIIYLNFQQKNRVENAFLVDLDLTEAKKCLIKLKINQLKFH